MSFKKSNVPHKMFWYTITAEILSISTITSQKQTCFQIFKAGNESESFGKSF